MQRDYVRVLTSSFVQLNSLFQAKTLLPSLASPGHEGRKPLLHLLLSEFAVPVVICKNVKRSDRGILCEERYNGRWVSLRAALGRGRRVFIQERRLDRSGHGGDFGRRGLPEPFLRRMTRRLGSRWWGLLAQVQAVHGPA